MNLPKLSLRRPSLPRLSLRDPSLRRCVRACLLLMIGVTVACLVLQSGVALAQGDEGSGEGEAQGGSLLWWIIRVSGVIGAFIFLLSFYFVAVTIQQFLELRQSVAAPPEILEECEKLIGQRNIQQLYDTLRADDSYFSRALVAGVVELQHGIDEAREKLDRQADAMTVEMEKKISMLAVLGTLGPMIGLLGTLKGMIGGFSAIAMAGQAAQSQPGGRGHLGSPAADVRRGGVVRAGDLLLRRVSQSRGHDQRQDDAAGRRPTACHRPSGQAADRPSRHVSQPHRSCLELPPFVGMNDDAPYTARIAPNRTWCRSWTWSSS